VTLEWTHDVVVVGGGGSGLAAAIEAGALARDVLLVEKMHSSAARLLGQSAR